MERDGVTSKLEDVGALVLANACGPCIGQVCGTSSAAVCIETFRSGRGTIRRTKTMVRLEVGTFTLCSNLTVVQLS